MLSAIRTSRQIFATYSIVTWQRQHVNRPYNYTPSIKSCSWPFDQVVRSFRRSPMVYESNRCKNYCSYICYAIITQMSQYFYELIYSHGKRQENMHGKSLDHINLNIELCL